MTLVIELTKAQEERLQADDLQFLKELRQNLLEKIELQKKHKALADVEARLNEPRTSCQDVTGEKLAVMLAQNQEQIFSVSPSSS